MKIDDIWGTNSRSGRQEEGKKMSALNGCDRRKARDGMNFVIFGAQSIALGVYQAFHRLYPQRGIGCFLVSQRGNNPMELAGIPVLELSGFASGLSQEEKDNLEILIATPENVMEDIEAALEHHGFHCHVRLTSSRWAQFMGYHYIHDRSFMPLAALPIGCHRPEIQIFMAKFYKDLPLTGDYPMPDWITPVQAGAGLCRERVADILDCDGETISDKNGNYSELTVLYWIWKNCLEAKLQAQGNVPDNRDRGPDSCRYYGLCHYRRILELSEDDVLRLEDNGVDVVLPYPMPYEPDIEAHHKRYLSDGDWQALLIALKELQPAYKAAFPAILHQQYFYNYNIILAHKEVLADYCSWLFPILERVEELSEPKGWERQDRYIGYLGETLETLYFMYHRDRLNIVHAGCRFLT